MKASEIRDLSPDEIQGKVVNLKEELLNLRFQHGTGQLENPQKIKQTRRVLARMKTIIKENEINKAD